MSLATLLHWTSLARPLSAAYLAIPSVNKAFLMVSSPLDTDLNVIALQQPYLNMVHPNHISLLFPSLFHSLSFSIPFPSPFLSLFFCGICDSN
jgi:hypothetical protein